ncbi:MAG: TonB-dependent receptor [Terriglobales bacterium]
MRFSRLFVCLLVLSAAASAAEIKITVLDPQSAAIAGAEVELFQANQEKPAAVGFTSAEGIVIFPSIGSEYTIRVLAPGFAAETIQTIDASRPPLETTIKLRLASQAETVVVTATRTPVPTETTAADVETLSAAQLQTENPIAAEDSLRFLPGAVVNSAGQRGGRSGLFVEGGDSRYNKVIVDGVVVDEPGGSFDFGTLPLTESDRLEFVRGAQSTLYGSDAMTSVMQIWTRTGNTPTPELTFGADGGNLGTANGYASLSGSKGRFDYNVFGNQFNTTGQGPNDAYSNSLEGANLGVALNDKVSLRLRTRHDNSVTGVQGEWNFAGQTFGFPPDLDQSARQNNVLSSLELTVANNSRWTQKFTGYESNEKRTNTDSVADPGRSIGGFSIDTPFDTIGNFNRAGVEYQGNYVERSWAQTTFGYRFEDENGFVGDLDSPPIDHGLRLNHDLYGQQMLVLGRLTIVAGERFVHNGGFGNTGVPRIALALQALRGGRIFSGTRLRFSYATGIKEPRFDESFAGPPFSIPNFNLLPERNRNFEAGVQQTLLGSKFTVKATYFNNLFKNQVEYATVDPVTFVGQYVNVNQSLAQGAEAEIQAQISPRISINTSYTYTSTQILEAPLCTPANFCDPTLAAGEPLLLRPKHSATALLTYLGSRWGGSLAGSFVGRRVDSDFFGFGINHVAGYVRVDTGGWYTVNSRVTAYLNIQNALDKSYEEVTGYPSLGVNFRAGMRFRIGGD